jgi:hypothetical protein
MSRAFNERDNSGQVKMPAAAIFLRPIPMRCVCLGSQAFRRMGMNRLPDFWFSLDRGRNSTGEKECLEILFKH